MIDFNKNSVFNLRPIDPRHVQDQVIGLLLPNEQIIYAFQTVRDQLVFTDKRIVSVDVQGITGSRKSFTSLPYTMVQYFSIQTPSVMEVVRDSELFLHFANGFTATFEFKGSVDIGLIGRMISYYVLH